MSTKNYDYHSLVKITKLKNTAKEDLHTFRGLFIKDRLDHILVSKDIKEYNCYVGNSKRKISDHKPLIAQISID